MSVNTLGFGSLASVAWTDMNGTGLTSTQLTQVNADKALADHIVGSLLGAINGAVNEGWIEFRLTDLAPLTLGNPPVTQSDLQREAWANERAAFIQTALDTTVTSTQDLSLSQWRRIAADLQDYAALQASKLPATNNGGGGIKNVNGHWFVNGQQVSLLDVYMAVRVNQVSNFDDSLGIYIQELNDNNRLVKACNDWLAKLRGKKPTDTASTVTWAEITQMAASFSATWKFDPINTFMPGYSTTAPLNYLRVDTWIEEVKGYVDAKDTENQTVQQKLEQMTNRRSEVLEGLTSFAKAQSQTAQSFSRNLG